MRHGCVCYFSVREEEVDKACLKKKKRVLKLIDRWKIALVSNITDLSCLSKNM